MVKVLVDSARRMKANQHLHIKYNFKKFYVFTILVSVMLN